MEDTPKSEVPYYEQSKTKIDYSLIKNLALNKKIKIQLCRDIFGEYIFEGIIEKIQADFFLLKAQKKKEINTYIVPLSYISAIQLLDS